jgi:hypothetical protein
MMEEDVICDVDDVDLEAMARGRQRGTRLFVAMVFR